MILDLATLVDQGAPVRPTDLHAEERIEPPDGDERKVGRVTASVSIGPLRRTKALASDALAGRMDEVEERPPSPAARLLIPAPSRPQELVVATDIYDVFRKVGR